MSNLLQIIKAQKLEAKEILRPGPVRNIWGVPAPITRNHGQNFFYWQRDGMKNATVLHIDGHSDMFDCCPYVKGKIDEKYFLDLGIANFLCAAIHYGVVDSIYWLNPHIKRNPRDMMLQDMGCSYEDKDRKRLETKVIGKLINWVDKSDPRYYSEGKIITPAKLKTEIRRPFILDVDLDAFCCHRPVELLPLGYNGTGNYKRRITETVALVKGLPRPDLITITRSEGWSNGYGRYVPEDKVDEVQDLFVGGLTNAFSKPLGVAS